MAALLTILRRSASLGTAAPDRDLLARFASTRDEDSFAEIVRRHGPVVSRICCRLLGPEAAEDAFQAVFLVLATRLPAALAAESIGGWLVGVAGRVARQMRRATRRRTRHEAAAAESHTIEHSDTSTDLSDQFRALDEELASLPDRLRDPVVLCLLQGHTQEEAAARLGRNARTLRRRLERAKQVLRARLERRGVVPVVAAALVTGVGPVSATVPAALVGRTIAIVFDFLTGGAGAACSAPVVLAKGVTTTMHTRKLMHLMTAAAAGLIGLGVVLAGNGPPVGPPTAPPVQPAPEAAKNSPKTDAKDEAESRPPVAPHNPAASERFVFVSGMYMEAAPGFCEKYGLPLDGQAGKSWVMTERERNMFNAILRAEPQRDILSRPQVRVRDGHNATFPVGQKIVVVTGLIAETKDGKTVYTPKMSTIDSGITLHVTPKVGADGKIVLRVESEFVSLQGPTVQIPVTPAPDAGAGTCPKFLQLVGPNGANMESGSINRLSL